MKTAVVRSMLRLEIYNMRDLLKKAGLAYVDELTKG